MDEVFLTYDVIRGQIIPRLDDLESFVYWSCTSKHYNSAFSCQLPPQLRDEALRRVSPKKLIAKQGWLHLREEQFVHLCDRVQEVFSREPTLLEIEGPIVVVGDIHGMSHPNFFCCFGAYFYPSLTTSCSFSLPWHQFFVHP